MSWLRRFSKKGKNQELEVDHNQWSGPLYHPGPINLSETAPPPTGPLCPPDTGVSSSSSLEPQITNSNKVKSLNHSNDKDQHLYENYDVPPPAYSLVPPGFSSTPTSISSSANFPHRPPPDVHYIFSPVNNSSEDDFSAGARFCAMNPLAPPLVSAYLDSLTRILEAEIIMCPESPHKRISIITTQSHPPTTTIRVTKKKCPDTNILSQHPLYLARYHHPSDTDRVVVFGYNLTITGLPLDGDSVIAMGFACVPYPNFRLPGWHRGSVAIHSDDGRRYCNDGFGGIEFTHPFSQGEHLSLGFVMRWVTAANGVGMVESEVVFLRNGKREGGWTVQEEVGEGRENPEIGLTGDRDVFAAVGVSGGKGVEVAVRVMKRAEAFSVILGEDTGVWNMQQPACSVH